MEGEQDILTQSNTFNKMNEEDVWKYWVEHDIFNETIKANKTKPEYVFYDGPPFMTGTPHYGHILAGLIKDSVLRYQHQKGFSVPRFAGSDTHGLPIEYEIEKELGIKTTQQVLDYGIGNYNNACESIVMRCADIWEEQMGRLGRWIDFKNDYKTMDLSFMNSVWWVFGELYKKNRIYEGVRIMPYSTACGTPLSNFEKGQNYKEIQDDSLYVKFKIIQDENSWLWCNDYYNCYLVVWTTTPWTLPTNYLLAINKNMNYITIPYFNKETNLKEILIVVEEKADEIRKLLKFENDLVSIHSLRGEELVGLKYEPFFTFNNLHDDYRVIHADYVSNSSGTGIVHISPTHGEEDYKACLENGFIAKESKLFTTLDTNGYVNDNIPELKGTFYKNYKKSENEDLNTWVIKRLKENNQFLLKKTIKHEYPFCWRSDTPLIYNAVNSWFVRVEDMRDKLVELNKEINWVPKSVGETRFSNWLGDARDWGISRNRFWGTPIPIWKSPTGNIICVSSSYELERLAGLEYGSITNLHRQFVDGIEIEKDGEVYKRIDYVFDCWLESGSMPYGTVGRVGIVELLEKHCKLPDSGLFVDSNTSCPYIKTDEEISDDSNVKPVRKTYQILPADFIAEGIDQTRGWFYTLLVLSASLFDMIPFKNVIVNGLILAENGQKMSKRLKNYPDPMDIVKEYGSDALRLYLLSSQATKAEALKFSKSGVHDTMKDIIIPLTNTIVFWKEYMNLYLKTHKSNPIFSLKVNKSKITYPINLWVLRKYSELRTEFVSWMERYELKNAVGVLYKLVQILNNGYIKMGRNLIKGKESKEEWEESLSIMSYIIGFILNDFKSIIPFFSESKYLELKEFYLTQVNITSSFDKSIHLVENQEFIQLDEKQIAKYIDFDIIYNIIIQIYQMRSLNDISMKKPVKSVGLLWDDMLEHRYSARFKDYLSMVVEECNLLDLTLIDKETVKITKSIVPIKALFFKKYGKLVQPIYDKLSSINSVELDNFIESGGNYNQYIENKVHGDEENNFVFDSTMFNYTYKIETIDSDLSSDNLVYKEFNFGSHKDKIILLMDKTWDTSNDKIYYYRLVATCIQKARKEAGLHPWDSVSAMWDGKPKYSLDTPDALEYIEKITRIKLDNWDNNKCDEIYSNYYENTDIKIHLCK
jgi:isoleucyl-tRNA synthetase